MNQEIKTVIGQMSKGSAEFCQFLASIYLYELTDEQIDSLANLQFEDDGSLTARGYKHIVKALQNHHAGTRQELAVDYAHVFLGAGSYDEITAPPYESVFTSKSQLMMQDARDKALKYYRSEGLDLPDENTIPEDHLGFELQFMATLFTRTIEALENNDEARVEELVKKQRGFFRYHQENWLPSFLDAVDAHSKTAFYHGVATITRGYLETMRGYLDELATEMGLSLEDEELKPAWMNEEYDSDDVLSFEDLSCATSARQEAAQLGAFGPTHD